MGIHEKSQEYLYKIPSHEQFTQNSKYLYKILSNTLYFLNRCGTLFQRSDGRNVFSVILLSHGPFAKALLETAELLLGPQKNVHWMSIEREDVFEQQRRQLEHVLTHDEGSRQAVILTDMFGGSASNMALSLTAGHNIEVLAGMNLPMLIKLLESRHNLPMAEASRLACETGKKYIHMASQLLNRKLS